MCGIAGIVTFNPSESVLDAMLKAQQHRGPNFTGKYVSESIVLGHNRLSIIDLSEAANQPFFSPDGRYVLVYNGEIYNYLELKEDLKPYYTFKTHSDTEVLLAAYVVWKEACLSKLNGMFAFAIWDTVKETLFAARDRFGVKPFYYHSCNASFMFASEIKTLFSGGIPKRENETVWANYFAYGSYGMPKETFWEGIWQLPSGHFLTYANHQLQIQKWYAFEDAIAGQMPMKTYEDSKTYYKALLEDSIRLRFRSDVPVGFNISGGVDSSTLLAFVNRAQKHNINAYTFYTNDARYDELPWVESLIALTQNPLRKVLVEAEVIPNLSRAISCFQDEPYGGIPTLAYAQVFKQAKQDGVTVLLDGQGMDEQWAGYDYYFKDTSNLIQGVSASPYKTEVLHSDFYKLASRPIYPEPFDNRLQNLQYRDLFYTKIPRALRFNDRVSMAYSTELREPFLDYRLVEFAFAQPEAYKVKNGTQKYLLRDLVSEYLTDTITYAPKRPLQTPQREWLGRELSSFVESHLEFLFYSKFKHWFNIENMQEAWELYKKGDQDSSFHIWQWVNLSLLQD